MRNILSFHRERPYEWKPGENTLIYLPLNGNTNNTGSSYAMSSAGNTIIFPSIGNRQVGYFNSGGVYTNVSNASELTGSLTYNIWIKNGPSYTAGQYIVTAGEESNKKSRVLQSVGNESYSASFWYLDLVTPNNTLKVGTRQNIVLTLDISTGARVIYVNGSKVANDTVSPSSFSSTQIAIGSNAARSGFITDTYLSNVIIENKAWTENDVLKYYNRSKGEYQNERGSGNAIGLTSKSSMSVDSSCRGAFMSNDGKHFYKALETGRAIVHYTLSTPYDLSTASQVYSRSIGDMQNQIFFDFTGKYLYTIGVKQYTLGTNWDISTATQTGTITPGFSQGGPRLCQVIDSTHLWISGSYNGAGTEKLVTLANPNDTSSVTMETFTRSGTDRMVRNHDGTRVLFSNYGSSVALQQGVCTTPYDISTLTSIVDVLTGLKYPYYAYTNHDKGLVLGTENNVVYYYELPNS